jgi:hypothetical protein
MQAVTSNFCSPVFYYITMGTPWLLVFDYGFRDRRTGQWINQVKFPGGMAKKNGVEESLENAVDREASEEVFRSKVQVVQYCTEDPIVLTFPSDVPLNSPADYVPGLHQKHFFLIAANLIPDPIRDDYKHEDDGVVLGIPRFEQVATLAGRKGILFKHHQVPLACLITHLMGEHEELRDTLEPALVEWADATFNANERREMELNRSLKEAR